MRAQKEISGIERTKFEAGLQVFTRSTCDYNCIYEGEIIKRTEKMVTIKTEMEGIKRYKIHKYSDGTEYIFPYGKHSMCAIFNAKNQYKESRKR